MGAEQQNKPDNANTNGPHKWVWWFYQPAPIDRFTGWLVLWTALLFIANIGTLIFVGMQWKVAADSQIDTRQQLRAVVGFTGAPQIVQADKDNKIIYYAFAPQFQNYGGTRTSLFHAWASVHYFGTVPNNIDLTRPYDKVDNVEQVIAPNSFVQIGPVGIGGDDLEKALAADGFSLLWGHADYADIFSPATIHHISFCVALRPVHTSDGKTVLGVSPYRPDCNSSD